jgi:hypothetical protein
MHSAYADQMLDRRYRVAEQLLTADQVRKSHSGCNT